VESGREGCGDVAADFSQGVEQAALVGGQVFSALRMSAHVALPQDKALTAALKSTEPEQEGMETYGKFHGSGGCDCEFDAIPFPGGDLDPEGVADDVGGLEAVTVGQGIHPEAESGWQADGGAVVFPPARIAFVF